MNLTRKDLEPYIGNRGRVSEILNQRRELSLNMIRNLHSNLSIPLESLISLSVSVSGSPRYRTFTK